MAIETALSIAELEQKATELGVVTKVVGTKKDGKKSKEDYISVIREHNLVSRYGSIDKVPTSLDMMLKFKSPMLAKRIDNLKEEQQNEIWNNPDIEFEEKLNGVRVFIIKDSTGLHIYSRHNSDVDLLPIEFTNKIMFPDTFDISKLKHDFIVDCEMTSDVANLNTVMENYGVLTETMLQAVTSILSSDPYRARLIQQREKLYFTFNSFDCLYYDGTYLLNEKLSDRRKILAQLIDEMSSCGFKIKSVRRCRGNTLEAKQSFYNQLIMSGGEGCVGKRVDGIYTPDTSRGFKGWIKIKRHAMDALNAAQNNLLDISDFDMPDSSMFSDTIDAWISGFEPGEKGKSFEGLIGAVCCSVYLRSKDGSVREHVIGKFSGIPLDLRKQMTEVINGQPTLKPEFYGRTVEIDGQAITSRELRLQHCVFVRFRPDKTKTSCIIDEDSLFLMI